jgi:TRAP transporter 4TM/12TM fusion protein
MSDVEDEPGGGAARTLTGKWHWVTLTVCVGLSLVHLVAAFTPIISQVTLNAFHFGAFALLASIVFPMGRWAERGFGQWLDLLLGIAVCAASLHIALNETAVYERGVRLAPLDWAAITTVIIGAMEFARRASGLVIPILILLALGYVAWWGKHVEGVFHFPGLSLETVFFRAVYGDDAMFGTIARISATTVFLFIIFGAFLLKSGAGDFIIALARAVAGKLSGGPGLVAVIASALTGTISGSAVANTASTGVITIPLMKKAGFNAKFSGAVEATASTGGQMMPPIMGAGAFVMAAYTAIPYDRIVAVSALPAVLYFASVAFFVRMEARKLGLGPMIDEEAPTFWQAIKAGGAAFFIPIAVVIWMLVNGYSPSYTAVIGIVCVIGASWLGASPMGFRQVVDALALGARNMITTALLLCSVGIVVNVVSTAGVGNVFSLMITEWAGGNIFVALVLIALASLVLGMGLPVTASYIVLATLSAPALAGMIQDTSIIDMLANGTLPQGAAPVLMLADPAAATSVMAGPLPRGEAASLVHSLPLEVLGPLRDLAIGPETAMVALLSAHMAIFWLSQDSNVTPPVCLAAFTAAAIAKSPPMATGFEAWKVAKGLYIVPILFAFTPILAGDWMVALQISGFALFGIYGLAAGLHGWMEARLNLMLRAIALAGGVACMWPSDIRVNAGGVGIVIAVFLISQWLGSRREQTAAKVAGTEAT